MKRFGLKGKSVRIEVILAIVVLLLVLCMGFGYCLRFTLREGNSEQDRMMQEMQNRWMLETEAIRQQKLDKLMQERLMQEMQEMQDRMK